MPGTRYHHLNPHHHRSSYCLSSLYSVSFCVLSKSLYSIQFQTPTFTLLTTHSSASFAMTLPSPKRGGRLLTSSTIRSREKVSVIVVSETLWTARQCCTLHRCDRTPMNYSHVQANASPQLHHPPPMPRA